MKRLLFSAAVAAAAVIYFVHSTAEAPSAAHQARIHGEPNSLGDVPPPPAEHRSAARTTVETTDVGAAPTRNVEPEPAAPTAPEAPSRVVGRDFLRDYWGFSDDELTAALGPLASHVTAERTFRAPDEREVALRAFLDFIAAEMEQSRTDRAFDTGAFGAARDDWLTARFIEKHGQAPDRAVVERTLGAHSAAFADAQTAWEVYIEETTLALQAKVTSGDCRFDPLASLFRPSPARTGELIRMIGTTIGGWVASVSLHRGESPRVDAAYDHFSSCAAALRGALDASI